MTPLEQIAATLDDAEDFAACGWPAATPYHPSPLPADELEARLRWERLHDAECELANEV